ncbi:MAG: DUF6151 family protein [Paracoccaceae bacterium]
MAERDLTFGCQCGKLRGKVRGVSPRSGTHVLCYCADCQAFAHHLGAEWVMDPQGGTPIYQILPSRLEFSQGTEHLACLRLTPKGLYRWYASCCNTPLANTVGPKLRLVGTLDAAYPDADAKDVMGPFVTIGSVDEASSPTGLKAKGQLTMIVRALGRHLRAGLQRNGRNTPFFTRDGKPVVRPEVLDQV